METNTVWLASIVLALVLSSHVKAMFSEVKRHQSSECAAKLEVARDKTRTMMDAMQAGLYLLKTNRLDDYFHWNAEYQHHVSKWKHALRAYNNCCHAERTCSLEQFEDVY